MAIAGVKSMAWGALRSSAQVLASLLGAYGATAWSADPVDTIRGRLLYENHCVVCHTAKVHRRTPPLAIDRIELRRIVSEWAREAKQTWGPGEVEDVVNYLDATFYRLKR